MNVLYSCIAFLYCILIATIVKYSIDFFKVFKPLCKNIKDIETNKNSVVINANIVKKRAAEIQYTNKNTISPLLNLAFTILAIKLAIKEYRSSKETETDIIKSDIKRHKKINHLLNNGVQKTILSQIKKLV